MSVNYGSKRVVVGAHYGLRDWLSQRITAVLMALFTVLLLAQVLFTKGPIGYDAWAGIFSAQWMKVLTFVVFIALGWHAWVGMRDIWMDYIKPVGLRLSLQVFTIVWLTACAGWGIQVLLNKGTMGYEKWAGIFASHWMKTLTFVVIIALLYHVWVGMRDIWMDYIQPVGIRLLMQIFTIVWLVACAGWAIQVLWRL